MSSLFLDLAIRAYFRLDEGHMSKAAFLALYPASVTESGSRQA